MKRILLVGLVVAGLTVVGFSVPAFAHGPEATGTVTTNQGTWEAMYEACWTGDWEAMAEAAEAVHGEDFGYMHFHGEGNYAPKEGDQVPANNWGGTWDHMGGGTTGGGGGGGGMMGW
jgi:hypothetical protein